VVVDTTVWTILREAVPDEEALAQSVAAELGEAVGDVRPSVVTATLLRNVDTSLDDLKAVVEGERARARVSASVRQRPRGPWLRAENLDDLLDEARRLAREGRLDLAAAVAVQRAAGGIAARTGLRLVLFLARLAVIRRMTWDRCVAALREGRIDAEGLAEMGRWIFLWTEVTSLVVTDGYRAAEREVLARDAQARRGALQELLGVVASDTTTAARLRRLAVRFGLDPDAEYRLAVVAALPEADPTPGRAGLDQHDLEQLAGRIGHLVGSAAAGTEGAGAGIRLPAVLPLRGRIVLLAGAAWPGFGRLEAALDLTLGGPTGGRARAGGRRLPEPAWVAVGTPVADGTRSLARLFADAADAVRTAEDVGLRGWIPEAAHLAVERLLLAHGDLARAAVDHELGPLLADERLGPDLVETLQVYFDAGENMRETARRLHLANRTVAYRLARIEGLLGGAIDDAARRRLAVALLVRRLQQGGA
jgi:hypothetical protein